MVTEGEVNNDRIGSNNDREGNEAPIQTPANVDPLLMREQIQSLSVVVVEIRLRNRRHGNLERQTHPYKMFSLRSSN